MVLLLFDVQAEFKKEKYDRKKSVEWDHLRVNKNEIYFID